MVEKVIFVKVFWKLFRVFVITWQAESFQSKSHVTTITQNLILVLLTSSMMPHLVKLPLGAAVPSFPMYLSPYTLISLRTHLFIHSSLYILVFLHTCLLTHLSPCVLILPLRLYTSRKNILLRYLSKIIYLSRHAVCHPWSL